MMILGTPLFLSFPSSALTVAGMGQDADELFFFFPLPPFFFPIALRAGPSFSFLPRVVAVKIGSFLSKSKRRPSSFFS